MLKKTTTLVALVLFTMGLIGCSRTVEDVARWESKENVKKLVNALGDPKEEVRIVAIESLGRLKAVSAVDALAACFNDPADSVRLASVDALIAIGGDPIRTPMIAALKLDNTSARLKAAKALGTLKTASAIAPLGEAMNDVSEEVQVAAAKSIAQIGDESGSIPLAEKLASAAPVKLRVLCAELLSETKGEVAYEGLVKTMGDGDEAVRNTAKTSLVKIGSPAIPEIVIGLKNDDARIRSGAIALLGDLDAEPTGGTDMVWFQLACASVDGSEAIDPEVVKTLVDQGTEAIGPLLEAASSKVPDIREHASQALEQIGEPCISQAIERVSVKANPQAREWFKKRSSWSGAPSWCLDLWGAIAALKPQFEMEKTTVATLEAKGKGAASLLTMPEFKVTRAYIPLLIKLLGDEASWKAAKQALAAASYKATLPLIAAIEDDNDAIASHAVEIVGALPDERAYPSIARVLQSKVDAGEQLSGSPFYAALLKLDNPEAEPLLLKIRPNTDRAIRVFERQFPDVRVKIAETSDTKKDYATPIAFLLTYAGKDKSGRMEVTFKKDLNGDWRPTPTLPKKLP